MEPRPIRPRPGHAGAAGQLGQPVLGAREVSPEDLLAQLLEVLLEGAPPGPVRPGAAPVPPLGEDLARILPGQALPGKPRQEDAGEQQADGRQDPQGRGEAATHLRLRRDGALPAAAATAAGADGSGGTGRRHGERDCK